jgi:hypothetical protein
MMQGEYTVEVQTVSGEVSLFAPKDSVDSQNHLLKVNVLEQDESKSLVYLPSNSFEVGSRFVTVSKYDLK